MSEAKKSKGFKPTRRMREFDKLEKEFKVMVRCTSSYFPEIRRLAGVAQAKKFMDTVHTFGALYLYGVNAACPKFDPDDGGDPDDFDAEAEVRESREWMQTLTDKLEKLGVTVARIEPVLKEPKK